MLPVTQTASGAMDFFDMLMRDFAQGDLLDELSSYVRTAFGEAQRHKTSAGVEQEIMRCMRAVNSEYDPEDREMVASSGVDIYMGITNLKVRALKSWVTDILANAEDQPWTFKATPMPELPAEAEEAVIDALIRELQENGLNVDLRQKAAYFKDVAQKHADKLAEKAVRRMETKVRDLMLEGGWRESFTSFISDLSTYPLAILKGPVIERVPGMRWQGAGLKVVDRLKYRMHRVHPLDFFPSPNSSTMDDGRYVIERKRMTKDDILGSIGVPGFMEQAVRSLIASRPSGAKEVLNTDAERDTLEAKDGRMSTTDNVYDVICYYGKVPGRMLIEHGVEVDDPQKDQEAEVWVCSGFVLRAILNPHPTGKRPFYGTSFEPVPGSMWGRSLPILLRDLQRVCNAASRSLVRNMAFASGPIGEYDVNRLANETNIDQIRPFRLYAVQSDQFAQTNQPALRFQKIDSNASELMKVYDYYSKIADDISGIPSYVLGNPATAGAGRTLGGLSMLMGNAAKGVKLVVSGVDRFVIEPLVANYYVLMMLFEPDPTIKADVAVVARGSSGLLQRELSQARAVEVLNMLTPYAQGGLVPPEGLQSVLRDVLRGLGYTADDIVPDPERQQQLMELAQRMGVSQQFGDGESPATAGPSMVPGTPMPQLDGRSLPPPNPADAETFPAA